MYATAWSNGQDEKQPSGYGLKVSVRDRDRHFEQSWTSITLELPDGRESEIPLSPSFWRSCSELRSADVGRWLLDIGLAPWSANNPPGIALDPLGGKRFRARVIKRRTLGKPS